MSGAKGDGLATYPEVFVAKGRDGKTDIWGIVCRLSKLDPAKKYPVIEYIYAGPHDSFVPKTFQGVESSASAAGRIGLHRRADGRHGHGQSLEGVSRRLLEKPRRRRLPGSHPVDQGALAKKYPYVRRRRRVGIYGTSAGGQSSTGALLFHPDFYKVAVSACGCHDNRMDKASWNEAWMGYPVGPHSCGSNSNITNAVQVARPAVADRRRDGQERPARIDVPRGRCADQGEEGFRPARRPRHGPQRMAALMVYGGATISSCVTCWASSRRIAMGRRGRRIVTFLLLPMAVE